jgi:hypothetical protein
MRTWIIVSLIATFFGRDREMLQICVTVRAYDRPLHYFDACWHRIARHR